MRRSATEHFHSLTALTVRRAFAGCLGIYLFVTGFAGMMAYHLVPGDALPGYILAATELEAVRITIAVMLNMAARMIVGALLVRWARRAGGDTA